MQALPGATMIVFELICADQHRFEGWFASSEDFDAQRSSRLLSCPLCGSGSVEKLPTAKIRKGEVAASPREPVAVPSSNLPAPAALNEFINYVLLHTEDVGKRFAQEARRMHDQEAPQRSIRGTATAVEAKELIDDGIPVLPLPIPPQGEWN